MEPGPGDPLPSPETHPTYVIAVENDELVSDNTCLIRFLLLVLCIHVLSDVGFEIVVERNTNYAM
jgi:hypothetical protein